ANPKQAAQAPKTPPQHSQPRLVQQAPQRQDAAVRPAYLGEPVAQSGPAARTANRQVRQAVATQPRASRPSADYSVDAYVQQAGYCDAGYEPGCGIYEPGCGMGEPACGIGDTSCGLPEPGCGIYEPGCAAPMSCDCGEPTCGICEPACGIVDPSCGCTDGCGDVVGCGTCVGRPGADYWCFPICLPRFKDLTVWGGVHGFKGPRDSLLFGGPSDNNFGFQEGLNIGGRAPFIGLMFPQLSYQLGYQAVQSRMSGTTGPSPSGSSVDRTQHFVTGGFFRRVNTGLQWGVVWDMMRDDLVTSQDFHQIRYELSIKSPQGRELGFLGTAHTNDQRVGGVDYQPVDQYVLFYRWRFHNAGEGRLWGGATNDSEGLFGGDFFVPLNNRWSLQTGFNYLIPDGNAGQSSATEESWNLGMNLVWHFGRTAKQCQSNPHRPLFQVGDNGSMFIDQIP
ncbi:MAG: hypothetical protein KDA61_01715, partial [Planctomycetales bacterium]|nr:hypothetical protein [Planctomycetales bacterium]